MTLCLLPLHLSRVQRLRKLTATKRSISATSQAKALQEFEPDTPPAARGQTLVQVNHGEMDALIARAQEMNRLLEHGYGCLGLEDCVISLEAGCDKVRLFCQKLHNPSIIYVGRHSAVVILSASPV